MKTLAALALVGTMVLATPATASEACLYGSATWASGSRIDGSTRVSTSWNGRKAFPKNGRYRLCLGSNPGKSITVYIQGQSYGRVYVNGDTRLDIVRRR